MERYDLGKCGRECVFAREQVRDVVGGVWEDRDVIILKCGKRYLHLIEEVCV